MLEEIKGGYRDNRYLVHNFNIEVRMIYNKNPKKNKEPMVSASLVVGGKFKEVATDYLKEAEGTSSFELQKQQMTCILKFLHFSSKYTQFQAGVQREFMVKTFEPEALKAYMDLYEEYKMTEREAKGKGKRHLAIKEKLMDIEKEYSYETIAEVRQKTINKYTLEAKKQRERQQLDKEIKRYKDSKTQGMIGQIFAAKTEEEKEEDEQDIEDFIERKEKEFEEKFKNLNEEMMQEDPIFTFNAPPTGMPENWAQFAVTLIIPSLVLKLLGSDEDYNRSIMDVETSGLSASVELGNNFLWAQIKLGTLDVLDKISKSKMYPYLTHTVANTGYTGSNAVEIEVLRDTTKSIAPIKLSIETKAQQYVIANFRLLGALKDFFTVTEEGEEEIDLSYYGERAKVRALELMNQGAAYIDNVAQEGGPYEGVQLDLDVSAPIIIVPDDLSGDNLKEAIVLNVGRITTISSLRPFDKKENYKKVDSVVDLYDEYKLEFRGFNLVMIKGLEDYEDWKQAKERIDMIKKITIILKAKRCIEPKHPKFPKLILFCEIDDISIFFSDYIMVNCLQIQESLMSSLEGSDERDELSTELRDPFTQTYTESQPRTSQVDSEDEEDESEGDDEGEYTEESHEVESEEEESEGSSASNESTINLTQQIAGPEDNIFSSSKLSNTLREGGSYTEEESKDEGGYSDNGTSYDQSETPQSSYITPVDQTQSVSDYNSDDSREEMKVNDTDRKYSFEESTPYSGDGSYDSEQENVTSEGSEGRSFEYDSLDDPNLPSQIEEPEPQSMEVKGSHVRNKSEIEIKKKFLDRLYKKDKNPKKKDDMRILIIFNRVNITVGELALSDRMKEEGYRQLIDVKRSKIPHINIFEFIIQNLEFELNQGVETYLNLTMKRLYIKDLQKNIEKGGPLVPKPFCFILCNPNIEESYENALDFENKKELHQLKVILHQVEQDTKVLLNLTNLRTVVTVPTLERLTKFNVKMQELQNQKLEKDREKARMKARLLRAKSEEKKRNEENIEESEHSEDLRLKQPKLNKKQTKSFIIVKKKTVPALGAAAGAEGDKTLYQEYQEYRNEQILKDK